MVYILSPENHIFLIASDVLKTLTNQQMTNIVAPFFVQGI